MSAVSVSVLVTGNAIVNHVAKVLPSGAYLCMRVCVCVCVRWGQLVITVNLKGNQSWIYIGRTDAEAEAPTLWPPDAKNWLIGRDLGAGKDWRREKGITEDETVGWHHWLDAHEFEQAPGVCDGQGSLACCSPWDHKELDMAERQNWTEPGWCGHSQTSWSVKSRDLRKSYYEQS